MPTDAKPLPMSKFRESQTWLPDDPRWKEFGYLAKARIKGRCAGLFVKCYLNTLRVTYVGAEHEKKAFASGRPVLYVSWHGSQLVPLAFFRNQGIITLTSLSRDGDIQDSCMKTLGYETIRGSSSRGGSRALLGLIRSLKKGKSAAITGDGPRGPYHEVKPGSALLAQKTDAVLLPVGMSYQYCHHLKNWDRFDIPLPFSRVIMAMGESFSLSLSRSPEEGARTIENRLRATESFAEQQLTA